jgi:hypothetical protein
MSIQIEAAIRRHTDAVISGKIPVPQKSCPRCLNKEKFRLHECRRRLFRYIIGSSVKVILTLLPRWKCEVCQKTFTVYPPFAVPHKRFVLCDIEKLCQRYIKDREETYCSTVSNEGLPIGYDEGTNNAADHFLAPSTIWRWIGWLSHIKASYSQKSSSYEKKTTTNPHENPMGRTDHRNVESIPHSATNFRQSRVRNRARAVWHTEIGRIWRRNLT